MKGIKWPRVQGILACIIMCLATRQMPAQGPIFSDDFENGADNDSVATGMRWLSVTGGGGTVANGTLPNYQTENNPFDSGSLYVRMYDPDAVVGPRLITSDTAGTDGREPSIAGNVTTFSFEFWEPNVLTTYSAGISFGYTTQDDLNSGERAWRGLMINGRLNPNGSNEGAAIDYPKATRHTVWMIANDTAAPLVDYRAGHTLDPADADVWISIGGADPIFAFALNRQNPTAAPQGVGFRSFSDEIGEVLIDNVLLISGASFDRLSFNPVPIIPGDTDGDGVVEADDFNPIRDNFRKTVAARNQGDLVRNNIVDFDDFHAWKTAFLAAGGSLAGVDLGFLSNVPEPGTLVLLAVAIFTLPMRSISRASAYRQRGA